MWALDMVFVVGGNGGNAGADAIQQECQKAGVPCSVIGVPKSIDNDILLVRTFLDRHLSLGHLYKMKPCTIISLSKVSGMTI